MGLIIPIAIIWKIQQGLTLSEAIFTESIVLLATAFADLPAGFIANRTNNKRSLLIGAALHVVGVGLLIVSSSLLWFSIAAIATGVAWAFISGADEAYIHDDFITDQADYKKTFATTTIVDEAATVVGMLAASLMLHLKADLRPLFVVATVLLAVHFCYTWLVLPRSQSLPGTHTSGAMRSLLLHKVHVREVWLLFPLMAAFAVIYEAGRPLWQPHMQQIGLNIASFGLIFALLKGASLGGSLAARYRSFDRIELSLMFALVLASLLAFGASAKVLSITALCIYLFTENYFRVYISVTMNNMITKNRAAMLSLGSVVRNGAGALIVMGAGLFSHISIFAALLFIVLLKLPAMGYIVMRRRET